MGVDYATNVATALWAARARDGEGVCMVCVMVFWNVVMVM